MSATTSFTYRVGLGCWVNDMRHSAMPDIDWPCGALDDESEQGILACLDAQAKGGFNYLTLFGLFATYAWPQDIRSAVTPDRLARAQKLCRAAQQRGIKILYGLGVYSWGFDQIIATCPKVRGDNPHAMCGSRQESWDWNARVIDLVLESLPEIGGFHLEASDQGRCHCAECQKQGDAQYYSTLNARAADYIRKRAPQLTLLVNMCGYRKWGTQIPPEDFKYLLDLSRHIDVLLDAGHHYCYFVDEQYWPQLIKELHCAFGAMGHVWTYAPQRWERLRWFLPYTRRTGEHLQKLFASGGRGTEYVMGPTLNPGTEVNTVFGGKMLLHPGQSCAEALAETLELLYRPQSARDLQRLVCLFQRAEEAYFGNCSRDWLNDKKPQIHEYHLEPLFGKDPGRPMYLKDYFVKAEQPLMTAAGRKAYRCELSGLLEGLDDLGCNDAGRIKRIKVCMQNTIRDIDACEVTHGAPCF